MGSIVITLEIRSFVCLLALVLNTSHLPSVAVCVFICMFGKIAEGKKTLAIYLLVYNSVSCIRNIKPKLLWSFVCVCSMRHILKRQNLRSPQTSFFVPILIQYRHKYRSDSVNGWLLYEPQIYSTRRCDTRICIRNYWVQHEMWKTILFTSKMNWLLVCTFRMRHNSFFPLYLALFVVAIMVDSFFYTHLQWLCDSEMLE